MKFKVPPINVPKENPFQSDALDRKTLVDALTALIRNLDGPFVLAIDAPWGTGKTTFVRMCQTVLESQDLACLYFNAWETDFSSDPIVAFVGELERMAKDLPTAAAFKKHIAPTKRIVTVLAKRVLPVIAKQATFGLLDSDLLKEEDWADLVSSGIKDAVDAYTKEKDLISRFRSMLSEAIGALKPDKEGQLIVFVDEIDRCKPTFAVELLERIKHLFSIPRAIFVLSVDKDQLAVSLKAVYGEGLKTDEYLRRFIDLEYRLPEVSGEKFTNSLYERFGFDEFFSPRAQLYFGGESSDLRRMLSTLSALFKLSLRAQEQCFTRIRVAMLATPTQQYFNPFLVAILVILRTKEPTLYSQYAVGDGAPGIVLNHLRHLEGGPEFLDTLLGCILETYLIIAKPNKRGQTPDLENYQQIVNNQVATGQAKDRATEIVRFESQLPSPARQTVSQVVSRIELAAQFNP